MNKLVKRFTDSTMLKPLLQLTAGSALAQMITIAVSPISTRLFSSEQLGSYTLFLTVISIFGPILNGKYDMSVVKAKDEESLANLLGISTIIGFVLTIAVSVGYSIYLVYEENVIRQTGFWAFVFLPVVLLVTSLINTLTSYNNLKKEYSLISKVYVVRTIVQNFCLVVSGFLKMGTVGLILSQTVSLFFGLKAQGKKVMENFSALYQKITAAGLKEEFLKEKNQLFFLTPATLLNTGSYSILNFFISALFGLSTFGYYSMSYRILGLPLALISGNVSRVYYQQAIEEKQRDGNYKKTFNKFFLLLLLVAIPIVIVLYFFSPWLFGIFFGSDWQVSGEYVQILAPMYGLRLIVSAVSVSLIISNKQQLELVLQLLFVVFGTIVYFIAKSNQSSPHEFFTMIAVAYSFIYLCFFFVIVYYSRRK